MNPLTLKFFTIVWNRMYLNPRENTLTKFWTVFVFRFMLRFRLRELLSLSYVWMIWLGTVFRSTVRFQFRDILLATTNKRFYACNAGKITSIIILNIWPTFFTYQQKLSKIREKTGFRAPLFSLFLWNQLTIFLQKHLLKTLTIHRDWVVSEFWPKNS